MRNNLENCVTKQKKKNYIYPITAIICVHVLKPNWSLNCVLAAASFQLKSEKMLHGICDLLGELEAVFLLLRRSFDFLEALNVSRAQWFLDFLEALNGECMESLNREWNGPWVLQALNV